MCNIQSKFKYHCISLKLLWCKLRDTDTLVQMCTVTRIQIQFLAGFEFDKNVEMIAYASKKNHEC